MQAGWQPCPGQQLSARAVCARQDSAGAANWLLGGTVGLLSLWLNSDVMWELGAHQAMSAFGVCPRWDALTEQLSWPLERCSDLLQAPAAGTSCLI